MASGSESTSSRSSNTNTEVTSTSQEEGGAADIVVAAHQAVLPVVDSPHPPRRRQRKPNRKTVKSEAESPAVISPIKKRGRKRKAAGRLSPLCFSFVTLPVLNLFMDLISLSIYFCLARYCLRPTAPGSSMYAKQLWTHCKLLAWHMFSF